MYNDPTVVPNIHLEVYLMGKVWFAISNFLLALLLLAIGVVASTAMLIMLYILGLVLILAGCSVFANTGEFSAGTLAGAALGVVPGVLLMKFADKVADAFGYYAFLFMGIFFIIFAFFRFAKCARETEDFYVEGFAAVCSVLYPLSMLLSGVGYILGFVLSDGWTVAGALLMIASSILWMIRTVIIVRDN